jgi:hypothetical protein
MMYFLVSLSSFNKNATAKRSASIKAAYERLEDIRHSQKVARRRTESDSSHILRVPYVFQTHMGRLYAGVAFGRRGLVEGQKVASRAFADKYEVQVLMAKDGDGKGKKLGLLFGKTLGPRPHLAAGAAGVRGLH